MKNLWYSFKTFIYSYTIQIILMIIGLILFFMIKGIDILSINDTDIYKYMIIGNGISMIPISIYLFKKYNIKENKIKINKLLLMIPLGMSISLFYNMLTIKLQSQTVMDINKYFLFTYVVFIAPIFEEIVYRYITYRKTKEVYSSKKAMFLVSLVFALMHDGLISMIYAFLLGILLIYMYDRYKNILYPIVIHISANMMSMFITKFNIIALIVSFIILLILYLYYRKENHHQ